MAKNPDPSLKLTTRKGVTRTLDDWATMFHLALFVLPAHGGHELRADRPPRVLGVR